MPEALLEKLGDRLREVGCPVCLNTRFSIVLRCDLAWGDVCAIVGECQHCGKKFDIQNVATLPQMVAEAARKFSGTACECGRATDLRFLCDLDSEDCYFVSLCPVCGEHRRVSPSHQASPVHPGK